MPEEKVKVPKSAYETIALLIAIYLLALTTALAVGAGVLWVRSSKAPTGAPASGCWRIQEAAGRVFKLNACTGETVEIIQERPAHTGARTTTS
ncbi:MAG TPA: hypothetical protein VGM74_18365 [Burkholderiaceae bacterium]|jgi:hypothetical protein